MLFRSVATLLEKITLDITTFTVDRAVAPNFSRRIIINNAPNFSRSPPTMASTPKSVVPRNHIVVKDNGQSLQPNPQDTRSNYATVVGKAAKLPTPPNAQVPKRPAPTRRPKAQTTSKINAFSFDWGEIATGTSFRQLRLRKS